jgi:hypothetical protein
MKCGYADHPSPPLCPLTHENIRAALRPMNWTHDFKRVCGLLDPSLGKNITEINLYFMGGSMTFGQSTDGCCCDTSMDTNCPANTSAECLKIFSYENGDTHPSYCSWGRYFGRWFQSAFPHLKINVMSLAARGQGSLVASESLLTFHPPNTAKSFTSTDIILLDYSVNDCSGGYGPQAGSDAESLIRRFYHYRSQKPILILLETYPLNIAGQHLSWDPPGTGGVHDYTTYYRALASHYHLPLWSYATAVHEPHTFKQPYFPQVRTMTTHPEWYVHLFIADTYASAMKSEIQTYCIREREVRREEMILERSDSSLRPIPTPIPPLLYAGDQKSCQAGTDHQYHINAHTEFDRLTKSPIVPLGDDELEWESIDSTTNTTISSSLHPLVSHGHWSFHEDRPTKPGWIVVIEPTKPAVLRFSLSQNLISTGPTTR